MNQIAVKIERLDQIKVVCGECERRAKVLWGELEVGMFYFCHLHVRCHDVDRLVVIDQFHVRVAEHTGRGELALLWEQLNDLTVDHARYAADLAAGLSRSRDYELSGHPEIAPAVRALERRLKMSLWFAERAT